MYRDTVYKTKSYEKYKVKALIVAGGVSANKYLKKEIQVAKTRLWQLKYLFLTKL